MITKKSKIDEANIIFSELIKLSNSWKMSLFLIYKYHLDLINMLEKVLLKLKKLFPLSH